MPHQRNTSDGLNIGEGFPTSYSTFAVTADARNDGRRSSTSQREGLTGKAIMRKRRTSAPQSSESKGSRLRGADFIPSKASFGFDSSEALITTRKSAEKVLEGFKKRWVFVLFFVAFSALVGLGTLLPGSTTFDGHRNVAMSNLTLVRATRTPPVTAKPVDAKASTRFARWAASLFGPGSASGSLPLPLSAGFGDLDLDLADMLYEEAENAHDTAIPPPRVGSESDIKARRGGGKRRTADDMDKDAHEHPSRAARRAKRAESLADEIAQREKQMAKRKQLRNSVVQRVARIIKGGSDEPVKGNFLNVEQAAHPELLDMDGAYIGMPGA